MADIHASSGKNYGSAALAASIPIRGARRARKVDRILEHVSFNSGKGEGESLLGYVSHPSHFKNEGST